MPNSISKLIEQDGWVALTLPAQKKVVNILKIKSGFRYATLGGIEILFAETQEALDVIIEQKGYSK